MWLLAACSSPGPVTGTQEPAPLVAEPPARAAAESVGSVATAVPAAYSLRPEDATYSDSAGFRARLVAASPGEARPLWVGLTLDCDGEQVDLEAVEVTGGRESTLAFEHPGPLSCQGFVSALWAKRMDCHESRWGCRQHAYVLDEPVATFPGGLYEEFTRPLVWARFPEPGAQEIRIVDAGAGAGRVAALKATLEDKFASRFAAFSGTQWNVTVGSAEAPISARLTALYRSAHYSELAEDAADIARSEGESAETRAWAEAPAALVILLGPEP